MEYRHTRTHAGTYGQHKNYHDARTWRSTVHVETRMVQARAGAEGWGEGPFESPTFPPQREAPDPSAVISREGQPSGSDRPQTAATRVLIQAPSPTSRCQIPGCIQFLNYPKHSFELSLYKWNTYNINNNSGNYYPLRRGEGRGREGGGGALGYLFTTRGTLGSTASLRILKTEASSGAGPPGPLEAPGRQAGAGRGPYAFWPFTSNVCRRRDRFLMRLTENKTVIRPKKKSYMPLTFSARTGTSFLEDFHLQRSVHFFALHTHTSFLFIKNMITDLVHCNLLN